MPTIDSPDRFPTPTDDLLREAVELAARVNQRLSERRPSAPPRKDAPAEPAPGGSR